MCVCVCVCVLVVLYKVSLKHTKTLRTKRFDIEHTIKQSMQTFDKPCLVQNPPTRKLISNNIIFSSTNNNNKQLFCVVILHECSGLRSVSDSVWYKSQGTLANGQTDNYSSRKNTKIEKRIICTHDADLVKIVSKRFAICTL